MSKFLAMIGVFGLLFAAHLGHVALFHPYPWQTNTTPMLVIAVIVALISVCFLAIWAINRKMRYPVI